MKPKHHKKIPKDVAPATHIAMTINIPRETDPQEFVAREELRRLGLQNETDYAAFSIYKNLPENFYKTTVDYFRAQNYFTAEIAASKNKSFVPIVLYVPLDLVAHVNDYLKNAGRPITPAGQAMPSRIYDAGRQATTGVRDAVIGAGKDFADATMDKLKGGFKAADGLIQMGTANPSSPQMWNAARRFGSGIQQLSSGFLKSNPTGADLMTLDAFLMLGGRVISFDQTIAGLEQVGRMLGGAERTILRKIFGDSVDYDAIRIKEGYAGFFSAGKNPDFTLTNNTRALTHGSTIYMKNADTTTTQGMAILVHETDHVWQYQNGGDIYLARALHAQFFGAGYEYLDAVKHNTSWRMLNPEQQAHLIEEAYFYGYFDNRQWNNIQIAPSDQAFLIQYMDNVLPQLRLGIGAR